MENKDPKLAERGFKFVMKNKERVKVKNNNSIVLIAAINEPEKKNSIYGKIFKELELPTSYYYVE